MGKPLQDKDHKSDRKAAREYAKRYRDKKAKKEPLPPMLPIAFHRKAYDRILSQPGCVGVRAYPGLHADGAPTLVLVGVDADGNDMVDGELSQEGELCPPDCPAPNELNS